MLKSILMGGAMLLAIPAFAQSTGTNSGGSGTNASPTGTTTNDHDPMESGDQGMAGPATTTGSQVNGGVMSSSPGAGQAGMTGNSTQGNSWSGTGTGTTGMTSGTTGSGTMESGTSAMGTSGTGTMTGAGGPFQAARTYPLCTRTRTDSCRQRGGR
jgi:hypothetical protein